MSEFPVRFSRPVTLAGGGHLAAEALAAARAVAPDLVAADGAADRLAALGAAPRLVVGDLDSLADPAAWRARPGTRLLHLAEQDTTDFEKCLYATEAPFYVAAGFTGGRLDHTLAVLHALLAWPDKRVVLLGEGDCIALVPEGGLTLRLAPGARVSLFPLVPVRGVESAGLRWSVAGLDMAPGHAIGTSNRADAGEVRIAFDRRGALVMLDPAALPALLSGLAGPDGAWSQRP